MVNGETRSLTAPYRSTLDQYDDPLIKPSMRVEGKDGVLVPCYPWPGALHRTERQGEEEAVR